MLFTMAVIIPLLIVNGIAFESYYQYTQIYSYMLEPAVVALGFPLYQQIQTIKQNTKPILVSLAVGIAIAIAANIGLGMWLLGNEGVSVSLALKSVTTPIGLALTEQLDGIAALTAVGIIVAGLAGGIFGIQFLNATGIHCKKSQGLAIGCASHALGTATISGKSSEHGAYSSLALIVSAMLTALCAPIIITLMLTFMR